RPIHTGGDSAFRRRTVFKSIEQRAESHGGLLLRHDQDLERSLLQSTVVDADAPAAELVAVDDQVVLRAARLTRIGLHQSGVLGGERTRERVVRKRPSALGRSFE